MAFALSLAAIQQQFHQNNHINKLYIFHEEVISDLNVLLQLSDVSIPIQLLHLHQQPGQLFSGLPGPLRSVIIRLYFPLSDG
jgi:hypothetical protein